MKKYLFCFLIIALSSCMTLSGNYELKVHDAQGNALMKNMRLMAQGSGIYSARIAICRSYPGAIVTIINTDTGEELHSESPYTCRK